MKIALIGRGKMGKMIATLAGDQVVSTIEEADVCIDFTVGEAVLSNVERVCQAGKDMVIGTSGWDAQRDEVKARVEEAGIGAIYSPNFSLGVARFLRLVERAKELFRDYDTAGWEIHHSEKRDAPSGTAQLLGVECSSVRCGSVPGTHTVIFDSPADTIELTHRARNREGFARGALEAAQWVRGRHGFFTLQDMIEVYA